MSHIASRRTIAALILLLALFSGRLIHTATEKSYTFDEPHYVGTGLYLWRTGDYQWMRVLRGHPPLAFHLASLPLLGRDLGPLPEISDVGFEFLHRSPAALHEIRLLTRLPFILLACWGAILLFSWAREVAGNGAGLLAVFLYTFCPLTLAHAPLAHSDITVTVMYLQTLYTFWRWCVRPKPRRLILCGLSLGLALLAKLSALLLLPTLALLVGARAFFPQLDAEPRIPRRTVRNRLLSAATVLLAICVVATAVLWLGYGGSFATTPEPGEPYADLPLPGYVRALLFDAKANENARTTFLFGQYSDSGWWYFFPLAFAVKTPLAMLGLLVLAALGRSTRMQGRPPLAAIIGVAVAVYGFVACLLVKVPLGLRYLLPMYPLLHLFIATRLASGRARWRRGLTAVCCLWLAGASVSAHPHYLAYFNELVGGSREGYRYLIESNLDWGQDLGTLARYLRSRGNPPVHLAYFGRENPDTYGIRAMPLSGCEPVAGLVAISANILQGLYAPRITDPPVPGCYAWLRGYAPVARPGYSIFVYDIPGA